MEPSEAKGHVTAPPVPARKDGERKTRAYIASVAVFALRGRDPEARLATTNVHCEAPPLVKLSAFNLLLVHSRKYP